MASNEITVNEALALLKPRFFLDEPVEDYDRRKPQDVLRKLCTQAGIKLPLPHEKRDLFYEQGYEAPAALRFKGFRHQDVLHIMDMLLDAEHRTDGTYMLHGSTRGTTRVNQLPADYVEHVFDRIEAGLKARDMRPELPKPAKKLVHVSWHAETRYPDVDGSLKAAFCEGLGIAPAQDARHFVPLFRDWVGRVSKEKVPRGAADYKLAQQKEFISFSFRLAQEAMPEGDLSTHLGKQNTFRTIIDEVLEDKPVRRKNHFASSTIANAMDPDLARLCGRMVKQLIGPEVAAHYSRAAFANAQAHLGVAGQENAQGRSEKRDNGPPGVA